MRELKLFLNMKKSIVSFSFCLLFTDALKMTCIKGEVLE